MKMAEKIAGIYGPKNKLNGRWYIGQSLDVKSRWMAYRRGDCKKQKRLYNAILRFGIDNFSMVLIETCDPIDWLLDYREMYWIRKTNALERGYNMTVGGYVNRHTDATKKKLREMAIGRKASEETRRKMRSSHAKPGHGPKHTEETKQRLRTMSVQQFSSPEVRQKVREQTLSRWKDPTFRQKVIDGVLRSRRK